MSRIGVGVCLCALGCAGSAPETRTRLAPTLNASAAPLVVTARVEASASAEVPPGRAPASFALSVSLEQVLTVSVTALALGEGTRIAVLADQPWLGDARGLSPKPLPPALRGHPGQVDAVDIFYGRDNEPRILGTRRDDAGERPIYLRHVASGWRDGREEIGRLGEPGGGALWGVLGAVDPELVCRVNVQCIVKRRSGWKSMPAGPVARLVTLQDGVLWSLDDSGLQRLGEDGWQLGIASASTPTWSARPRAFWATQVEAWVSSGRNLLHYRDGGWTAHESPVGEALSFWGARAGSLWIAGTSGAAHFDGADFQPISVPGPLHVVFGRSDHEVWFGGERGLFRVSASGGS